jgi:hypothetical protein
MSVGYVLVNFKKREVITFAHIGATSARELAGSGASSAITTWYLLRNVGDSIAFVSDTHDDWPFEFGSKSDLKSFTDITNVVIEELFEEGILSDCGLSYIDEDEPDTVFIRDIRNVWQK